MKANSAIAISCRAVRFVTHNLLTKRAVIGLVFLGSLCLCSFVVAQPPAAGKNPPANRVEVDGMLRGWQGNMMQVVSKDGKLVSFQIPDRPGSVRFKGKYKFESLTLGLMVRVEAPAAGGQFLEPFKSIEVFVPDQSKMTARSSFNDQSLNVPGIYPVSMLSKQIPGASPNPNVRVVGSIVNVSPNKLALQCGAKSMTIDLTDTVVVNFAANSLQFAKQGDHIKTTGYYYPATGQFSAASIEVNGAKPLGNDLPPQATLPSEAMKLRVKEKSKSKSKKETPADAPETPETMPALSPDVSAPKP